MTVTANKIDWAFLGPVLGILGMFMAIAGGWMSFESRITAVEQQAKFNRDSINEIKQDVKDANSKLDRLVEREK